MSNKVTIIAECGINHSGQINIVKKLIDGAISVGADMVKFQKRNVEKVYTEEFLNSPRNDGNPYGWKTQREQKMGIELTKEQFDWIDKYCKGKILWGASAWDEDSVLFLRQYDLKFNKIASALLPNKKILEMVAEEGKYTYISTGMVESWEEIDNAVDIFEKYDTPYCLLHCVSTYPMENAHGNLLMIKTLKERYGCPVGWSDHSQGRILSLVAIGLGATVIERHISLNRASYGSDQAASLELADFERLIVDIRGIEQALGTGERILTSEELATKKKLRG